MESKMHLGKSSLLVPRLGIGAMTWGDPRGFAKMNPAKLAYGGSHGVDEERSAVQESISCGANLFDTAAMYGFGASESRLGELLAGRDVIIATKFPRNFFFNPNKMPDELDGSLKRLGRSSVHLYQHHFPTNSASIPRLMELMADAVEAGKVIAAGVSNYSAEQMRTAHEVLAKRGIPLASNQVEYSLLHRQPETNGVLAACRELGVTLIAYMPLASGALSGKYISGTRPRGLFRRSMRNFRAKGIEAVARVIALLKDIGERYGKSPAQVALRWLMEQENVLPIPGAKNGRQAGENGGALSFGLTGEEIDSLDRATLAWRR